MESYVQATERFLSVADWLTDEDAPMVTALRQIAAELDSGGTKAALVAQFGVTYRTLAKRTPDSHVADEAEDFLKNL